jgi:hypothetical protein
MQLKKMRRLEKVGGVECWAPQGPHRHTKANLHFPGDTVAYMKSAFRGGILLSVQFPPPIGGAHGTHHHPA